MEEPTGNYYYALAMMQPGNPVPALLLKQESVWYEYHVRVFQYDPDSETVIQPDEILIESTTLLMMMNDGNGIRETEISQGTGDFSVSRITLEGNSLVTTALWSGILGSGTVPDEYGATDIEWYDIKDAAGLDNGTEPTAGEALQTQATETDTLPTDGDRIVLTGTVGSYTYDELIALQGIPESQTQWLGGDYGQTYLLIVLDTPQELALINVDKELWSGEVTLIDVSYAEGLEQYDGQHVTFSIDPYNTWWPSDASLPLGEPGTSDIHILN